MSMEPAKRPILISVAVYLLFALALFNIWYTFTGYFARFGLYYSAANVLLLVLMLAGLSGVLAFERWGLWVFSAALIVKLGVDLWSGAFHPAALLLLLPLALFLYHRRHFI